MELAKDDLPAGKASLDNPFWVYEGHGEEDDWKIVRRFTADPTSGTASDSGYGDEGRPPASDSGDEAEGTGVQGPGSTERAQENDNGENSVSALAAGAAWIMNEPFPDSLINDLEEILYRPLR